MKGKGRRGKGRSREPRKKPKKKGTAGKKARAAFEFLDHPADVGFIARGETLEAMFAAASRALCDYGWNPAKVRARQTVAIRAKAASVEDLLYSWLSEVLFLADAERWVFKDFAVERIAPSNGGSQAQRWEATGSGRGEKFDQKRHRGRTYIKAVTYHQLAVERKNGGWQATVYLDV